MQDSLNIFVRIVKERSLENISSIMPLFEQEHYGTCIPLLRQELDSLIRVCYLNKQSLSERKRLINDTILGVEWRKNENRITDRKMVNIANQYNHWASDVYDFGNCFTHLTNFHDYKTEDPILSIQKEKKEIIKKYLSYYHGFSKDKEINTQNILPDIPKVVQK